MGIQEAKSDSPDSSIIPAATIASAALEYARSNGFQIPDLLSSQQNGAILSPPRQNLREMQMSGPFHLSSDSTSGSSPRRSPTPHPSRGKIRLPPKTSTLMRSFTSAAALAGRPSPPEQPDKTAQSSDSIESIAQNFRAQEQAAGIVTGKPISTGSSPLQQILSQRTTRAATSAASTPRRQKAGGKFSAAQSGCNGRAM